MSSWRDEQRSRDNPLRSPGDQSRQPLLLANDDDEYSFATSRPPTLSDRGGTSIQAPEEPGETVISTYELPEIRHGEKKTIGYWWNVFVAYVHANTNRQSLILLTYLVLLILIGTSNRVTFKIMQYASYNYSYFISQLTTFIYLPVNFGVILFKLLFTNDISPDQRTFPWYKFLVMGTLDSMQGLLIVVGGLKVPGTMQNLLLQGAVPVTMLFSIFLLRNRGCDRCLEAKKILGEQDVHYTEEPGAQCTPEECQLSVTIDGTNINGHFKYDCQDILREKDNVLFDGFLERDPIADVRVQTSATPWSKHFKTYYTIPQYLGATIILFGLVVSVWPAFQTKNQVPGSLPPGGLPLWDLVFFSSNIPTALSGVYKEIAFRTCEDMDVWWLNGWVALWQFTVGLSYAPLAAVMTGIEVSAIPENMYQGFQCVFEEHNSINLNLSLPACQAELLVCQNTSKPVPSNNSYLLYENFTTPCTCSCAGDCGNGNNPVCCDSCNGRYPPISSLPAWSATLMYMSFNIAYNVFLVLVIKHGSAALMYIASTVVLPLGSVAFTSKALLGPFHAQPFTVYTGAGLGVVLLGLIVYRFLGKSRPNTPSELANVGMGTINITLIDSPAEPILIRPRTVREVRNRYYNQLGLQDSQSRRVPSQQV